jgi:hypothetical protein
MEKGAVCGTPQREEKHIVIDMALNSLEIQIKEMERLIDKIKGQDCPKEALEPASQNTCLHDFMDYTPDRINAYSDRIKCVLDQLNQSIF